MSRFDPGSPPGHLGDALSGLLDGELPATHEDVALAHLAACPSCAEELLRVGQAKSWVRALPRVEAPVGFYEGLLVDRPVQPPALGRRPVQPPALGRRPVQPPALGRRASPAATRANLRRRRGLVAIGAAAAAVTVLGVATPRPAPVSPAVPRLVEAHATSASVGADVLGKLAPMGVPVSFGR